MRAKSRFYDLLDPNSAAQAPIATLSLIENFLNLLEAHQYDRKDEALVQRDGNNYPAEKD